MLIHWAGVLLGSLTLCSAQEVIYQEGFNDDGEAANPKRYTTLGRAVYEIPQIRSDLNNTDQLGPIYWAHNFEVSFVGVPGPTPARRMISAVPQPSAVARMIRARHTCFCRLLRSATTAVSRSSSAALTSMLIPSRIEHYCTRPANMESCDCVVPLDPRRRAAQHRRGPGPVRVP